MKTSKQIYLSLFFFVCFFASFTFSIYQSYNTDSSLTNSTSKTLHFATNAGKISISDNLIYEEETESELEDDISAIEFFLPDFLSYIQRISVTTFNDYFKSESKSLTEPIYIALRNLRI